MKLDPNIFRAYDIRGIVDDNLTAENVRVIGQAIGSEAQERGEKNIIMARDGRLSGPVLSKVLCEGLLSAGCNVINIDAVPTPALYFATHQLNTSSGVMLTGSHNPSNYNGIKIVLNGEALTEESIQQLYQRILDKNLKVGQGVLSQANISDRYIDYIKHNVRLAKPLKIVIDSGNGIGGAIAPQLFKSLGCDVTSLYCEVDGHFPNHHPDPSHAENLNDLIRVVKEKQADIGLAFDGDADRLGVVTPSGKIIWPDQQLIIFAVDILSRNPNAKIVYDVKCTRHLPAMVEKNIGQPVMCKTGHSFVKAKMREIDALLGGEMSGHLFFKERWFGFDDGLYAGARFLEILSKQDRSVDELFDDLPRSTNTPELKLFIDDSQKFSFMKRLQQQAAFPGGNVNSLDGIRVDFANGWGLVRPSNTTPCLIFRFEADDVNELSRIQELFKKEILALDPSLELPF